MAVNVADLDNDGRKDLFCANGDLNDNAEAISGRVARQTNLVLAQRKDGTFDSVTAGPPALPLGIQFCAKPFDEATLFRLSHAYQSATDWHKRRPPLSG